MLFSRSGIHRPVVGRAGASLGSGVPLRAAPALAGWQSWRVPSPPAPAAVSHAATRPRVDAEGRVHLSAARRARTRENPDASSGSGCRPPATIGATHSSAHRPSPPVPPTGSPRHARVPSPARRDGPARCHSPPQLAPPGSRGRDRHRAGQHGRSSGRPCHRGGSGRRT